MTTTETKSPGLLRRMVGAIDAALAAEPKPVNFLHRIGQEFESSAGRPLVADADLDALRTAAKKWQDAWKQKNYTFTQDAARVAWRKLISDHGEVAGSDDFEHIRSRGLESFESEFQTKTQACEAAMRQASESVRPIIKATIENFIAAGDEWIKNRTAGEQAEAKSFGLAYVPSELLTAAKRALAQMKNCLASGSGHANPAETIPFLNLTND